MKIGIDLLWVRPGICGGTESVARNLLTGFGAYDDKNEYVLFVTRDNAETFTQYGFELVVCNVDCARQSKRILWENLHLDAWARERGIDLMLIPVYSKPRSNGKIPYITTIHDLQALHYPEYFGTLRKMFLKYEWKYACKSSAKVVTISDYCKQDLAEHYPFAKDRLTTIYDAIVTNPEASDEILEKLNLTPGTYFYCCSSLLPHKNLPTLIKALGILKREGNNPKLVISSPTSDESEFVKLLEAEDLTENVIRTGFVSATDRDALYRGCSLFLFPSVFEGFGMPPIEAMRFGKRVVMTRETCLEEVTQNKAIYVENPMDPGDWADTILAALSKPEEIHPFPEYNLDQIVSQYKKLFDEIGSGR